MRYVQDARPGHAAGHLREPVQDIVEALRWDRDRWWQVDDGNGEPFASPQAAYDHLARLKVCGDIVPRTTREMAQSILGEDRTVTTYAQLSMELRRYLISQGISG